jgi:hypothetical protein
MLPYRCEDCDCRWFRLNALNYRQATGGRNDKAERREQQLHSDSTVNL